MASRSIGRQPKNDWDLERSPGSVIPIRDHRDRDDIRTLSSYFSQHTNETDR